MDTPQHKFVSETGRPTQRRHKVRLACNLCRERKTACDGKKPVCSACTRRNLDDRCGYSNSVMQQSAALTLVDLDRRVQKLENENRADHGMARQPEPDATAGIPRGTSITMSSAGSGSGSGSGSGQAMDGQTLGTPFNAFASDRPMTPTNASFMGRGSQAAVSHHSQDPTAISGSPRSVSESPTFPRLVGFSMQMLDQPLSEINPHAMFHLSRPTYDQLLDCYWQNYHAIFPFLHWPTFQDKYHCVWERKAPPDPAFEDLLFLATLNMVLALACLRSEAIPLHERQPYGDIFYKGSLQLISADTLDTNSIPVVQLLLLRALYPYFAGMADRCWLATGTAIRAAMGMGLHLTPKRHLHQLDREMRRRVWFGGCVSLDQIVATAFGRTGMISPGDTKIPLPMAIDEEYLSANEEGRQPDGIPSRMDMIIYTVKVLEVVEEMRAAARAPRLEIKQPGSEFFVPDPSVLLSVNCKIDVLLAGLPEHLHPDANYSKMQLNEDTVKCFQVQSAAVRFRLLLLRLFLLRPSLLAEAQRWTTPNSGPMMSTDSLALQEKFHMEICELCLKTVHTMLDQVHKTLATNGGVSAWYALHFTFASATVLLVATRSPRLGVSLETEPTRSSWARAIAILEFHKEHVASAARGIQVLLDYRESIMRRAGERFDAAYSPPEMPDVSLLPSSYVPQSQHGQQYRQPERWEVSHSMPTPPTGGQGTESFRDYTVSEALKDAWLTTQDWGPDNWLFRHLSQQGGDGTRNGNY